MFAEYARTKDPELRGSLIEAHVGLALSLANKFASRNESPEDLHQAALLGLLHAVDRYDPTRGVQFTTFAWATISGELKRHFRDRTWGVRVPRRVQEHFLVTAEAIDALTVDSGRAPTVREIAERTGLSEEEVIEALDVRNAHRLTSLDAPVRDEEDGIREIADVEGGFVRAEQRADLERLVEKLPVREREILQLRFADELTQAEIADRIGVSQMHVSRILSRSLGLLRGWAEEEGPP